MPMSVHPIMACRVPFPRWRQTVAAPVVLSRSGCATPSQVRPLLVVTVRYPAVHVEPAAIRCRAAATDRLVLVLSAFPGTSSADGTAVPALVSRRSGRLLEPCPGRPTRIRGAGRVDR